MSPPLWDFLQNGPVHALGVSWDPVRDELSFKAPTLIPLQPLTKRKILSVTARLFDPLGWLCPFVDKAKIMLQELWNQCIGWNEPPNLEFVQRWKEFELKFRHISEIHIPR